MAGEVRSQLTITLRGGGGGQSPGGGGSSQRPVGRRADLTWGPGQRLGDYGSDRQMRWSRVMAMEAAQDRQSVREIQDALMRHQAERELNISSQRRAREAFIQRVKNNTFATEAAIISTSGFERSLKKKAYKYGKEYLKGGIKAGFAGFMAGEFTSSLPEGGGIHGAALRMHAAQLAGAGAGFMFGGPVGAATGASLATIIQAISEVKNYIQDLYQMGQKLDDELKRREKAIKQMQDEIKKFKEEALEDLKEAVEEARREVAEEASKQTYRTTRYVYANLTGN